MDDLQGPETIGEGTTVAEDPEAPFGRRKDGTPYKRDPGPFAHMRGRPFGSLNGKPPAARAAGKGASVAKRATVASPPRLDAAGYAKKIRGVLMHGARVLGRRSPVSGALVAVRAKPLAESWGNVAITYPKLGRAIDRISKGTDLSDAIGGTLTLALMIGYTQNMVPRGTWFGDMVEAAVLEALHEFETADEFEALRVKLGEAAAEAASRATESAASDAGSN